MDKKLSVTTDQDLLTRIRDIWEAARTQAIRTVNSTHVCRVDSVYADENEISINIFSMDW